MKIIDKYYDTMKNLRVCSRYMEDVKLVQNAIDLDEDQSSGKLCSDLIIKYQSQIDRIGKLGSGRVVIPVDNLEETYSSMEEDDYIEQLSYLRDCIIMISAVYCGLAPSLEYIVRKMNVEKKFNMDTF